jgi:hypothetical protein
MYAMTPAAVANAVASPFEKLWRGRYSLPVAFWVWFVIGTILSPAPVMLLSIPLYYAGMPQAVRPLLVISTVGYPIFAAVGVWRSANARPFQRWPVAAAGAKIGVCIGLLTIACRVTGMGFIDLLRLIDHR